MSDVLARPRSSTRRRAAALIVVLALTAPISIAGAGSARAAPPPTPPAPPPTAVETLATSIRRAVPAGSPAIDRDVRSTDTGFVAERSGITTRIPTDPASDITVRAADGDQLGLRLPSGLRAASTSVAERGTIVYSGPAGAAYAVEPLAGGGVRALVWITAATAPTEYRFPIRVPPGGGIDLVDDGSVDIYDAAGTTAFVVAPAWARDARGRIVPTSYSLDGTTLVQTVYHRQAAHPVVADPSIQADCGWVTCTVRFSRAMTRNVRDGLGVLLGASSLCAVVGNRIACAVIALRLAIDRTTAGRYYENGNCLGYRFYRVQPTAPWPVQVSRNTYNCR